MGIYLNPGNQGFQKAARSKIYIDKSGLIEYTNEYLDTEQRFLCVSRPRRFGKSMALKMLSAYYCRGCNSEELFQNLEIAKHPDFKKYLNQLDVIYLDMTQFLIEAKSGKVIEYLEQEVLEEIYEEYGEFLKQKETGLANVLRRIYAKTGREFVFLIDEWDCVMRECQDSEEMQKQYLDFLRNLLKDKPYVALAYMTGILPVKKYGVHSALNMFAEYSMTNQRELEEYTGFTEAEVKGLCTRFGMDFNEVCRWYDGYCLKKVQRIFNPKSVVDAMLCQECSNYWTATETYEALKKYINMNLDGLRDEVVEMLGHRRVPVRIGTFKNDMQNLQTKDDALTLLIHLGYLAYDSAEGKAFIPNNEIIGEFENAISDGGWENVMKVIMDSESLLQNTLDGREEEVAAALDRAHTEIASNLDYNTEFALGCAVILAYWSARKDYKIIRELPVGYGYADIVFLPLPGRGKPAIVVELKHNKTAKAAMRQIKDKRYADALRDYSGEVVLVGISYDRDKKEKGHSCKIERDFVTY